jgi:sterol desaturase/sphingolipid hydroxylase (fatty acid hydroxylase superfamily)
MTDLGNLDNILYFYHTTQVFNASVFFVLIFAALEGIYYAIRAKRTGQAYDWKNYLASAGDLILRRTMTTYFPVSIAMPGMVWLYEHRIYTVPSKGILACLFVFLMTEFCYYWLHRINHSIRLFWAGHIVHHSPNVLNLSVAYRWGITTQIGSAGFVFAPLAYLGFNPVIIALSLGLIMSYQYWIHTEWIPKLKWAGIIFNTPSHHRVHHACNPEYNHANYGGILIIYDRLFGTFVEERDDVKAQYGLRKPILSYNPIAINFYEWRALVRDLWRARSWHERFMLTFGRPGWEATREENQSKSLRSPSVGRIKDAVR